MTKQLMAIMSALALWNAGPASAEVVLNISSSDFGITDTFNEITFFRFDITLAGSIAPGVTYNDPAIVNVDYRIDGTLGNTPSGFPAFALQRTYSGANFYSQSPEASLVFSIDASADLSDGLQLSELAGTGNDTIFYFMAREFNQNPGRYHPPELTLRADGSGLLRNANNQSTFANPPPPMGSGMIVNVEFGEEYISDLSFNPNTTTLAAVPEPSSITILAAAFVGIGLRYRSRQRMRRGKI